MCLGKPFRLINQGNFVLLSCKIGICILSAPTENELFSLGADSMHLSQGSTWGREGARWRWGVFMIMTENCDTIFCSNPKPLFGTHTKGGGSARFSHFTFYGVLQTRITNMQKGKETGFSNMAPLMLHRYVIGQLWGWQVDFLIVFLALYFNRVTPDHLLFGNEL